ncbi:GNAT family N-acetyltransferase [Raineyella sp. LH-20]|uniref:GNAT family N-acetyltransferase n=1 Tax=Raineyella sp. LH-20 TaxID=3081204 RepID=UPI00295296B2|nr:GNAT family N-acetyltransferase [Raineyella sp. LH-20]WOP19688.1 GNAT family N-acetyltransferase [Raineyella sp. LH-20]
MEVVHTTPAEFSTDRLDLRRIVHTDLDHLAELYSVPSVLHFLGAEGWSTGGRPPSLDRTRAHLAAIEKHWEVYGFGRSAVIERVTGDFVGLVGLQVREPWDDIQLDFLIARDRQRRGYGVEAGRVWVDWARREDLTDRLVVATDARHEAAFRTARALGFRPDWGSPPAWASGRVVHRLADPAS